MRPSDILYPCEIYREMPENAKTGEYIERSAADRKELPCLARALIGENIFEDESNAARSNRSRSRLEEMKNETLEIRPCP